MKNSSLFRVLFIVAWSTNNADTSCTDTSCQIGPRDEADLEDSDMASLLQVRIGSEAIAPSRAEKKTKDLVFMHMPYNFGNTIEEVAMFPSSDPPRADAAAFISKLSSGSFANPDQSKIPSWAYVRNLTKPGGENWGHFNPDLMVISDVTKCPLYLTPPKYWPEGVAKKYIGDKKVFGVVRDPYEKLVAQFRGAMPDYGGSVTPGTLATCNINKAVKDLLKKVKASGDMFQGGCTNIPQSEFFEGPYGITIPVDNWRFPKSANEVLEQHGYSWHIRKEDILHVSACEDHWSKEFDDETRSLVREIYAKDFDIICKSFGHCNYDQDTCLQGVHHMCPSSVFTWDAAKEIYCPKPDVNMTNIRARKECS